jgi:enoyl-CoA hydratase
VTFENLEIENHGAVRRILLARESQRNAQSRQLLDELDAAFSAAATDPAVHVVILGGKGAHFSAGHDLKQAQAERSTLTVEERWAFEGLRYFDYCLRIWDFPKPTIAQVQGACVAGGFMLANMCDLIMASESAYFSDPVGHTLGAAATEVLIHPWVLGLRKAKEMLFTGGRMGAQEALAIGLVNRVVPDDVLGEKTLEMAQQIAKAPSFGLHLIKRSLNRTLDAQGLRTALSAHFDTHQLSHLSEGFTRARDQGLASAIQKKA